MLLCRSLEGGNQEHVTKAHLLRGLRNSAARKIFLNRSDNGGNTVISH